MCTCGGILNNRKSVMEVECGRNGKARVVLDLVTWSGPSVGHTALSVSGDKIPPGCHCIWSLINLQCRSLNSSLFYVCIWLMALCGSGPETRLLFTVKAVQRRHVLFLGIGVGVGVGWGGVNYPTGLPSLNQRLIKDYSYLSYSDTVEHDMMLDFWKLHYGENVWIAKISP